MACIVGEATAGFLLSEVTRGRRRRHNGQDGRQLQRSFRRGRVECIFARRKHFRRMVTRAERHVENVLGFVPRACIVLVSHRFVNWRRRLRRSPGGLLQSRGGRLQSRGGLLQSRGGLLQSRFGLLQSRGSLLVATGGVLPLLAYLLREALPMNA